MKPLFIIFALIICNPADSVDSSVKKNIFEIYRKEVNPYLQTFAKNSFENPKKDIATQNAVLAQYNMLVAKITEIENKVDKILTSNPKSANDSKYVSKLLDALYAETFPGLPPEFWNSVRKKVDELKGK